MITREQLFQEFNIKCATRCTRCKLLANQIITYDITKRQTDFDNLLLTSYINFIKGCRKSCGSPQVWSKAVHEIIKTVIPTINDLQFIVAIDGMAIPIFQEVINKGVILDSCFLKQALTGKRESITSFFLDHIHPEEEYLNIICDLKENYNLLEKILNYKIKPSNHNIQSAIQQNDITKLEMLVKAGAEPSSSDLLLACQGRKYNIIRGLIMIVKPEKVHFQALFKGMKLAQKRPSYYYGHNNVDDHGFAAQLANIFDDFIKYGYKPDIDDVVFAMKYKCHFNNIKELNYIKFDETYYMWASYLDYYPYNEKDIEINATKETMYGICEKCSKLAPLKKMIKDGFVPDQECLARACKSTENNGEVIKFLLNDCKIIPNGDAVTHYLQNKTGKKQQVDLFDKYRASVEAHTQKLEQQVKELEKQIEEMKAKQIEQKVDEQDVEDELDASVEIIEENIDNSLIDDEDEDDIVISDKELEEELTKAMKKIQAEQAKKPKPKFEDRFYIINLERPKQAPSNKRIKRKVSDRILKFAKTKETKMSFIELRKMLADYIVLNKLNNRNLVKINSKLSELLDIEKGYVEFKNFDELVYQCYKNL